MNKTNFQEAIKACLNCVAECQQCASACLAETEIKSLSNCILLNNTCSVICLAAAEIMAQRSDFAEKVCTLCAEICNACADECERHPNLGHCQKCAEACRMCAELCLDMTGAMQH